MKLRRRLLPLLVLAMVLDVAPVAAGPNFSLSASPSFIDTGGGLASTTITVTPSGGFTAHVGLSVSGLLPGVTAELVPGATAGTTILWLTVSSAARQTANTTLVVTGSGGGLTHTLGIHLSVPGFVSDFWIFASPATCRLARGSTETTTIFATALTGFRDLGLPTFSASRLPPGVTASFGPTSASGLGSRATLTLTAADTAAAGGTAVIVTGRAGTVPATTRISLTVT